MMKQLLRFFLIGLWVGVASLYGQSGLQLGLSGAVGSGAMVGQWPAGLNVQSQRQLEFRGGLDVAYFFTPSLGIATGVGIGAMRGGFALENSFINGPTQVPATTSPYYLQSSNQALAYLRTDTINSQTETLRLNTLEIPVLLRFRTQWFYAEAGPIVGIPLSSTYKGEGEVSYAGTFNDLSTTVYNTGFGFQNYTISGEGDFAAPSPLLSLWASVGTSIPLSEKTELRLGLGYRRALNGFLTSGSPNNFFTRTEGDNAYYSLVGAATQLKHNGFAAQVGLYQSLGGGGGGGRSPKPDCTPEQMFDLPLAFVQNEGSRRVPAQVDPDFLALVKVEASTLRFKGAELDASGQSLRLCLGKDSPEAIEARFTKDNAYLSLLKTGPVEGLYEMVFEPRKKSPVLKLVIRDGSGKSLSNVKTTLLLAGEPVYESTLNSGDAFTYLYLHPALNYSLRVEATCFEAFTRPISQSDDWTQPLLVELNALGEAMQIQFPANLEGTRLGKALALQGTVVVPGMTFPIQGTLSPQGGIALSGNCAPDQVQSYQLALQKPVGYDLYHGGNTGNWANPSLTVDIVNDRPLAAVKVRRLPQFHVYYIDLSDVRNRYRVMDSLDQRFQKIKAQGDSVLVYMSNGNSPTIARKGAELDAVVQMMYQATAPLPNARTEKAILKENIDLSEVIPDRRQVILHFVLSNGLYLSSRQVLIGELSQELKLDLNKVRLRIYTEELISAANRLDPAVFPQVEYIYLAE